MEIRKYNSIRSELKTGDIVCFISNTIIANAIKIIDKAEVHHTGTIVKAFGRVFIMDAQPKIGTRLDLLSLRIKEKKYTNFFVLSPIKNNILIANSVKETLKRAENFVPYGYSEILGVIKERIFKMKVKEKEGSDICSESTQHTSLIMGMKSFTPERIGKTIITPQDFFRFYLPEEYTLKYKD